MIDPRVTPISYSWLDCFFNEIENACKCASKTRAKFLFLSSTSTLISILIRRKGCAEVSKRITLHTDRQWIGIEIVGIHSTWRAEFSQYKRKKVLIASTVQHAKSTHVSNMASTSSKRRGIVSHVWIHIAQEITFQQNVSNNL